MQQYSWPGNIRELQNVIERCVILAEGEVLRVEPGMLMQEAPSVAIIDRLRIGSKSSNRSGAAGDAWQGLWTTRRCRSARLAGDDARFANPRV